LWNNESYCGSPQDDPGTGVLRRCVRPCNPVRTGLAEFAARLHDIQSTIGCYTMWLVLIRIPTESFSAVSCTRGAGPFGAGEHDVLDREHQASLDRERPCGVAPASPDGVATRTRSGLPHVAPDRDVASRFEADERPLDVRFARCARSARMGRRGASRRRAMRAKRDEKRRKSRGGKALDGYNSASLRGCG